MDKTINKKQYLIFSLILFLTLALRLCFIHEPLDRDEGTYAVIGQEILKGAIPYRDVIEIKPPGAFYIFALFALLGKSTESIRVFTAFYTLVTITVVFLLARHVGGNRAGLLAGLLCGVFTSGPVVQGSGSNTEVFMLLPVMIGSLLILKYHEHVQKRYLLAGGFFFALTVMIKTVALPVYLIAMLFVPFIGSPTKDIKNNMAKISLFAVPAVLLILLTWGYLSWNGAWEDFIYWNYTYNKSYASTSLTLFMSRFSSRGLVTASEFLLLWVISLPTVLWMLSRTRSVPTLFLIALAVATFVGVCMPGKFWPHYFIPLIPPLAVISGIGLDSLIRNGGVALIVSSVGMMLALYPTIRLDVPYYIASPDEVSRLKFGGNVFVEANKVAQYIAAKTMPEDTIFQWGWEPEIYAAAMRRPPNRFIAHLLVAGSPDPEKAVYELVSNILTLRPKYIVVQAGREAWPGSTELSQVLFYYYHLETNIGMYTLYRSNIL